MRLDHFNLVNEANHPWAEAVLSQLSLLTGLLLRYNLGDASVEPSLSGFNVLIGEPSKEESNYLICFKSGDASIEMLDGKVILGDVILQRLGLILSLSGSRSPFDPSLPCLSEERTSQRFELHSLLERLTEAFKKACLLRGVVLQRVCFPGGSKFAVALTHDIDYMEAGWLNRLKFTRSLLKAVKSRGLLNTIREREFLEELIPVIGNGGRFNLHCLREIVALSHIHI